jgi:hypothetical protein
MAMQFVERPKITDKEELLNLLWAAKGNYAEVGRLAGLSRERIRQLVNRITEADLEDFNCRKVREARRNKLEFCEPRAGLATAA